jgi:hypothetical protein
MFRPLDDHVLKQITETGFHGAFVSSLDFEVVGDCSALSDLTVRLREKRAWRISVFGAAGVKLFERLQPRVEPCKLVFARSHHSRAPFVLDARGGQFGLA